MLEALIFGEFEGGRLDQQELIQNCIFLLNAGHETTTSLMANGLGVNGRTKIPPLAGVKIHHFARLQVCPQTRLAQCLPQHRSYAGLWSSRIVWEWSGVQGLIALLQPITVTVHLQDMNMMCQPI